MGYNTGLLFLNDALGTIRDNPEEFTEKVCNHCSHEHIGKSFSVGNHCNPVQVIHMAHADYYGAVVIGGNTAKHLGTFAYASPYGEGGEERFLKALADHHGFRLVRKNKKDKT